MTSKDIKNYLQICRKNNISSILSVTDFLNNSHPANISLKINATIPEILSMTEIYNKYGKNSIPQIYYSYYNKVGGKGGKGVKGTKNKLSNIKTSSLNGNKNKISGFFKKIGISYKIKKIASNNQSSLNLIGNSVKKEIMNTFSEQINKKINKLLKNKKYDEETQTIIIDFINNLFKGTGLTINNFINENNGDNDDN
jgi:hypothetical protein